MTSIFMVNLDFLCDSIVNLFTSCMISLPNLMVPCYKRLYSKWHIITNAEIIYELTLSLIISLIL